MRILHTISQHPEATGSGIYLQAMLRQSRAAHHASALVAAVNDNTLLTTHQRADVVDLVSFGRKPLDFPLPGMSDVMPYVSSRFCDLSLGQIHRYEEVFLDTVARRIDAFAPDIIHSHHLWLLSSLIKKNFPHIPMVVSSHGSDLRQFRLCPHLCQRVLEGCSAVECILSLTPAQKEEIVSLYGLDRNKIIVTGAGYNSSRFCLAEKAPPPPIEITYCGKLSRAKGVPWMLKALQSLNNVDFHFHLVGSGSGPEEQECLLLARSLTSKITVHGSLSQPALAEILQRSHLFVLPSLYEGLPLVVLEALACGCHVVTTELAGAQIIADAVDSRLMTMIALPRLHRIDHPVAEDEPAFVAAIAGAIEAAARRSLDPRSIDSLILGSSLAPFTWKNIFAAIEKHYYGLL